MHTKHRLEDPTKKEEESWVFNRKDDEHTRKIRGSFACGHEMSVLFTWRSGIPSSR